MKNKAIIITALFLIISVTNFVIYVPKLNLRSVDMLSILAIGFLAGTLLTLLFGLRRRN